MKALVALAVIVLGVIALAVVAGALILALDDRPPLPTEICMIGGGAVTGLAAVGAVIAVTRNDEPKARPITLIGGEDREAFVPLEQPPGPDEAERWGIGMGL